MTESQKKMIRVLRGQGKSYTDIASTVGMSASAIKMFFHRSDMKEQPDGIVSFCKYCQNPITQSGKGRKRVFCGSLCKTKWWNENRKYTPGKETHACVCSVCNTSFYSYGKAKYCSRKCYFQSRLGREREQK